MFRVYIFFSIKRLLKHLVKGKAASPFSGLSAYLGCATCRAGSLYGELARFILRLLGYKSKSKELALSNGQPGQPGQSPQMQGMHLLSLQAILLFFLEANHASLVLQT